jgi:hypothetical protein
MLVEEEFLINILFYFKKYFIYAFIYGAHGSLMVKALCYKAEGSRLQTDEVNEFFNFGWTRPRGLPSF